MSTVHFTSCHFIKKCQKSNTGNLKGAHFYILPKRTLHYASFNSKHKPNLVKMLRPVVRQLLWSHLCKNNCIKQRNQKSLNEDENESFKALEFNHIHLLPLTLKSQLRSISIHSLSRQMVRAILPQKPTAFMSLQPQLTNKQLLPLWRNKHLKMRLTDYTYKSSPNSLSASV